MLISLDLRPTRPSTVVSRPCDLVAATCGGPVPTGRYPPGTLPDERQGPVADVQGHVPIKSARGWRNLVRGHPAKAAEGDH